MHAFYSGSSQCVTVYALFLQALAAIRKFNMSAAIFAPGWVWETQGKENFIENENRLEVVHIYTMYL